MHDLLFSQRVTRDFAFEISVVDKCHLKLEAKALKIDSYDTNLLSFLLVLRSLISSDQMIIGYFFM